MNEVLDGEYQKYVVEPGSYIRKEFFGKYPELAELVKGYRDEDLHSLRRGGHDPEKVYAAFKSAIEHEGSPTVILRRPSRATVWARPARARTSPISRRS